MAGIRSTTSSLTSADRRDHVLARIGYKRMYHRVDPGLYSLGAPNRSSPVFVTANYTLSFDALRTSLVGMDCYILVLDTKGVNVWCAAGKRTFSTDEVVRQIEGADLQNVVEHRTLILPQLGAPGVSAHEVKRRTGFKVEYGPVLAQDIPEYMRLGKATEPMRTVHFPIRDRAVLVPVEIKNYIWLAVLLPIVLFIIGGSVAALFAITAILGGVALFPLLLPFLPTKEFTSKGMILGLVLGIPFFAYSVTQGGWSVGSIAIGLGEVLLLVPTVAYLALNFTGCSTYTSRTGVRHEIFTFIPWLALMAISGAVAVSITIGGSMLGWF